MRAHRSWMLALGFVASAGCQQSEEAATAVEDDQVSQAEEPSAPTPAPKTREDATRATNAGVQKETSEKLARQSEKITKEAVDALRQTQDALRALDGEEREEALGALEKAVGKLEVLLARRPELALAATSVQVETVDVLATLEEVEEARERAEELLDEGQLQDAREELAALASEVRLRTTHIPMGSYPKALKEASAQVETGELEAAQDTIRHALGTLVVTETVLPLPVLRAGVMFAQARELGEQESRTKDEQARLSDLLDNARYQLELGQALGYGEEDDYEPIYADIESLEEKAEADEAAPNLYERIRSKLDALGDSFGENASS